MTMPAPAPAPPQASAPAPAPPPNPPSSPPSPQCRKCGKQSSLVVYENLLDARRNPMAECANCSLPAMIAGDANFATLQVKTTGAALIDLIRLAVAGTQKAIASNARNGGGGGGGHGQAAPGQKACKMCGNVLANARYAYCYDCKQKMPDCPCGRGKLGWSSRDKAYFDRCYQCTQDEKAAAANGPAGGDIPW